jgi:signal recognition particle subunit SEC65
MMQSLTPRTGTAPLQISQPAPWSANWGLAPEAPAQAGVTQSPATPALQGDAAHGLDGQPVLDAAARAGGALPVAPQYAIATPPKVDPPKAVVPSVSLSGSTQNRIDTLIGVQQGQIDAIASGLDGMGFKIDPNKTSLGLTPTQQFYADMVGVLMGVEDGVKDTDAYKTLHKLYVSMPSQLSANQLAQLGGVVARLSTFQETVTAATELRLKINQAKADKNPADVDWWEGRLKVLERDQRSGVEAIVSELQRLNYTIDESKTSLGLTPTQQFYSELTGIFVSAEDAVKEMPEYKTLHELYLSMPSELSKPQLANLGGVANRIKAFAESVKSINGFRVEMAQARADKDNAAVQRLEGQIARETERQQGEVRGMVSELQRLNYKIDPNKTSIGLSPTQQFYADVTGVLMGVEDEVKQTDAYKTLHHLYMSMPSQLSAQQLADLSGVMARLSTFPDTVKAITTLRGRVNEAKEAKDQRMVDWWEGKIKEVTEAQKRGVAALVSQLQGLNYQIDPSKIDLGLSPTQQFYADVVGVLQGAEDDVKSTDAYKRFHELYLSMPGELSQRQLADLAGVSDRMKAFAETAKTINALRVDISAARTAKDNASVARYERQITDLTARQNTELQGMVADLQRLNYRVDPNKTSLGLTPTQQFYADMVGVLMGVEDGVKESEAYKTLHQLYASMPSQLSAKQLSELSGVVARLSTFQETVKAATELRLKINQAKADKNPADVDWWEGRLKVVERDQRNGVEAIVSELQRLNYTIDESKTSLGLTPTQAFYNDLSGILTMAEDKVKESASFKRLAQLYASMPSELSEAQLRQLRGVWGQIRGVDPISDQINGLRVLLAQEQAEAKA